MVAATQAKRFLKALQPNMTTLGYGLFLAINAAGVWGGVFPFLPSSFQTPEIMMRFFLAQSLVFSASYFVSFIGIYLFPKPTRRFMVSAAATPYFLGWCLLIAAIYLQEYASVLVILGGGVLGLGTAGFFMLWQRLFASQDADTSNHDLILGTAFGAFFYFSLYLIPVAVTVFLIPFIFLPLFWLYIILKNRTINLEQPMFEDLPYLHPHVYKQILHDYWRGALAIGALGFCAGILRALAIDTPEVGSFVNIISMLGCLILAIGLLAIWQNNNLRINIFTIYRAFFPFIISGFIILPFLSHGYTLLFTCIIHAAYTCATIFMTIQCTQTARDEGINPVFIYGFIGGIVYLLHDIGFIMGKLAENLSMTGLISPIFAVSFFAIYLLGFMYFVGGGGFRQTLSMRQVDTGQIELIALNVPPENQPEKAGIGTGEPPREGLNDRIRYRDRFSKQCALLQRHYRLSARETEVMELIARGNSVSKIAEDLIVSENTIRTHTKRIYAKLDIHKKQELLDLVESFDPSNLP